MSKGIPTLFQAGGTATQNMVEGLRWPQKHLLLPKSDKEKNILKSVIISTFGKADHYQTRSCFSFLLSRNK